MEGKETEGEENRDVEKVKVYEGKINSEINGE